MGRPTDHSIQLEEDIVEWISEGKTLREFCRKPENPSKSTVYDWMNRYPEFSGRIARARDDGFDEIAEECLEIADDATNDWETRQNKDGSEYESLNPEVVNRSRLRIDTRLKLLAKWNPKKYGDKVDMNLTGEVAIKRVVADL